MRYHRTTGLGLTQMQELVRRVSVALREPWQKKTGRPRSCGLHAAVEVACIYLRQNCVQEFLADLRGISQSTVSRIVTDLVPVVRSVLAEFVPSPREAIQLVEGKVCLVDGTITPCWSYAEHRELWSRKHGTTGFCVQVIGLLDGTPVWISEPLPGSTHDKNAYDNTATTEIVNKAAAGIGDKGYQGAAIFTPTKKPQMAQTQRRREEGQRGTLGTPRTRRTTRRPFQKLANSAHRLPAPIHHLSRCVRCCTRVVLLLSQMGF